METRIHVDPSSRAFAVERIQDVENIIERNKRLQNDRQRPDVFHHVASIPNIFLERWLNEEHARGNVGLRLFSDEFDRLVFRKLRDPDWAWLRTTDRTL